MHLPGSGEVILTHTFTRLNAEPLFVEKAGIGGKFSFYKSNVIRICIDFVIHNCVAPLR